MDSCTGGGFFFPEEPAWAITQHLIDLNRAKEEILFVSPGSGSKVISQDPHLICCPPPAGEVKGL